MGWAQLVLLESLCSLMSLQSPASQLDDSLLEVGTVMVTGHTCLSPPSRLTQACSPRHIVPGAAGKWKLP